MRSFVLETRDTFAAVDQRDSCRIAVFSSELGWMSTGFRGRLVTGLVFGHESPGAAIAALGGDDRHVCGPDHFIASLIERLQAFAAGTPDDLLDVALELDSLTPFQLGVVERCRHIPFGGVLTYGQLAAEAGFAGAARAVGNVMARNRFPLIVPCHRVVGAHGSLGGYSSPLGLSMKRRLLEREGSWPAALRESSPHPSPTRRPT